MPYRWSDTSDADVLELWPHQSLTGRGFSWFIGSTAFMLLLPILAVLGTVVAWILMVFFLTALWGVWHAIRTNQSHLTLYEELKVQPDLIKLVHRPATGRDLEWAANPHWVTIQLRNDGPVDQYLTLRGGGREVELGRFLSPEERQTLYADLMGRLRK